METKAKSGAPVPKGVPRAEKKEPVAPRKADPAPDAPAAPASPEVENPLPPPQDGAAEQEAAPEGGQGEVAASTDSLESLKPFLIGGAIIAAGAILLGVLLLARRN